MILAASSKTVRAAGTESARVALMVRWSSTGPSKLETQLRDGLKAAMKSKDRQAVTCLKATLADITNIAKASPNPNDPAPESAVIQAIRKGIDKRKEAADIYSSSSSSSSSSEQQESLLNEIKLLSSYLPESPSSESLSSTISEAINGLSEEVRKGKGVMGPAMKAVLEKLGDVANTVDRKEISKMVQEALKR